jgi:toxin ParE1/3/4
VLTLVWRASALDDLQTIIAYIADRNLSAAARLQDAIEACAERLPDHPYLYRPGRVSGTREAVVHPNYYAGAVGPQIVERWLGSLDVCQAIETRLAISIPLPVYGHGFALTLTVLILRHF